MSDYDMSDEEKKRMLDLIQDSWARMERGPVAREWSLPSDILNPGSSNPQAQNLHALPIIDQTKTVNRTPGGRVESDGQFQFINKRPGDAGVKRVQGAKQMIGTFDGNTHLKNLTPLDQGVLSTPVSAPPIHDVHVADQNLHRAPLPSSSVGRAPAVNVNSGVGRPGSGIPTNVNIR